MIKYVKLLKDHTELKFQYDKLNNNFMKSAYKKVLDYENAHRTIENLEAQVLNLKLSVAKLEKNEKKIRAIESLIERKGK